MRYLIYCLSILIVSCQSHQFSERTLTVDEMQKYHLNGIIHDVEMCQHTFSNEKNKLINTGNCEIVNCEQKLDKIICTAKPKK